MTDLTCPVCSSELTMAELFSSEATQQAFARLAAVSIPLGARVMAYTTLFAPPKTRLTVPKQVKVILKLLPDLQRQAITHRGREWRVPLATWAQGIDEMLNARNAGRLELPMKGHGYLYAILCNLADKHEGAAEALAESQRRTAPRQDTVQIQGQTLTIGAALGAVYGQVDATLASLDARDKHAAPMPTAQREHIKALLAGASIKKEPKP